MHETINTVVDLRAFRARVEELVESVQRGEVVTIADRGKAIAELRAPTIQTPAAFQQHRKAVRDLLSEKGFNEPRVGWRHQATDAGELFFILAKYEGDLAMTGDAVSSVQIDLHSMLGFWVTVLIDDQQARGFIERGVKLVEPL